MSVVCLATSKMLLMPIYTVGCSDAVDAVIDRVGLPGLYILPGGPKKRNPCFNFGITFVNVHQF